MGRQGLDTTDDGTGGKGQKFQSVWKRFSELRVADSQGPFELVKGSLRELPVQRHLCWGAIAGLSLPSPPRVLEPTVYNSVYI
jgi:hypothetical protein